MANKEQVERLKAGVEEWNAWRWGEGEGVPINLREADFSEANLSGGYLNDVNLFGADLSGATLNGAYLSGAALFGANLIDADLREADLSGADLRGADLEEADLEGANLEDANLREAYLSGAVLFGANLSYADLGGATLAHAHLSVANLSVANLSGANLWGANLSDANLSGANLSGANLLATVLGSLDLSRAEGLAEVNHYEPSQISTDTLERTAQGLATAPPERRGEVETFLRGAGVPEHYLEMFRSRIGMPIEFYSAFISYSHADKPFAQRLYADLQARGIRCWLDEKDMRLGSPILEVVNQAIRTRDRVILCCSLASLTSRWVEEEIEMAFQRSLEDKWCLIPLDLDGYLFDGWTGSHTGWIRSRLAGNFVGWKQDADLYARELERVVEAMRPRGDRDGE